jgi:ribosome-associated protein
MKKSPEELLNRIAQVIYDKKGRNILALDVRGFSNIADYVVIAEGNVDRHVVSIARALIEDLEEKGERALYVEGLQTGDWVVIDFVGIMVHLFEGGLREKYSLEKLWQEGKIIDLEIDTSVPNLSRTNLNI